MSIPRINMSRAEFARKFGRESDPDTIGVLIVAPNGEPVGEIVFTDDAYVCDQGDEQEAPIRPRPYTPGLFAGNDEVMWLEKLFALEGK